jgi:hypothetical protein
MDTLSEFRDEDPDKTAPNTPSRTEDHPRRELFARSFRFPDELSALGYRASSEEEWTPWDKAEEGRKLHFVHKGEANSQLASMPPQGSQQHDSMIRKKRRTRRPRSKRIKRMVWNNLTYIGRGWRRSKRLEKKSNLQTR